MLVRIGAGERVSKLTHLTMGHTGVSVVHVSTSCLDFDLIIVHRDVQIFAFHTRQVCNKGENGEGWKKKS